MRRLSQILISVLAASLAGCATTIEDRNYEAIYFVEPKYPAAELQAGVCGQVLLVYDLSKSGKVVNIRSLASTSESFVGSATEAAKRFKYKPRVQNGRRVATKDIKRLVTFAIEGASCEGGKLT